MLDLVCALANRHGGGTISAAEYARVRCEQLEPVPRTTTSKGHVRIHPTMEPCSVRGRGIFIISVEGPRLAEALEIGEIRDACGLAEFDKTPLPAHLLKESLDSSELAAVLVSGVPAGRELGALGITYRRYGTGIGEATARRLAPQHERWVPGPLPEAIEALVCDVLAFDRHRPDLLEPLLWELLINAVGHRSYAPRWLDTPIELDQFTDQLRISSPGALPRRVAAKDGAVEGRWSRNPHLMSLLQRTGRALQQGRGLTAGPQLARTAGMELSVEDHADRVVVRLQVVPRLRFRPSGEVRQRLPVGEREARIIAYLATVEQARTAVIAQALVMPASTTRATLAALVRAGRVAQTEREPRSPKQAWRLTPDERHRVAAETAASLGD